MLAWRPFYCQESIVKGNTPLFGMPAQLQGLGNWQHFPCFALENALFYRVWSLYQWKTGDVCSLLKASLCGKLLFRPPCSQGGLVLAFCGECFFFVAKGLQMTGNVIKFVI